jgi:hypothetical protein
LDVAASGPPGILLLLWVLLLAAQWGWAAPGTFTERNHVPLTGAQAGVRSTFGTMPGSVPILADLDGDERWDFVAVRLIGYDYKIAVVLSSRAGVALLTPPARMGLLTVNVCDINGDHVQDILVRSPATAHPVAVWLGKGNGRFEAVDPTLFPDGRTSVDSTAGRKSRRLADPDILFDPVHPVGEKIQVRIGCLDPDPSGSITEPFGFVPPQHEFSGLAPRSPPNIPAA